jgi:hypothetical protein
MLVHLHDVLHIFVGVRNGEGIATVVAAVEGVTCERGEREGGRGGGGERGERRGRRGEKGE